MQIVFWVILGIVVVCGLFYYGKCQLLEEKIYVLEDKLYETKALKHRTELIKIKDEIDKYKKGGNPYTVLAQIGNAINESASLSSELNNADK